MKYGRHIVLPAGMLLLMVSVAAGGYLDVFVSTQDPTGYSPQLGVLQPGQWYWPAGIWQKVSLNYQVPVGTTIWLGLENVQVLNQAKTVTLKFTADSFSVVPIVQSGIAGFTDGRPPQSWTMSTTSGQELTQTWTGTISPQPGWEWIKLQWNGDVSSGVSYRIETFSSVCIPEPGTVCLLALGGLAVFRKGK